MNTFIFQLFAICFLAYYCQGMEKEETKGKDKEKNTPAPSKVEKNPKKPDGAKIAYNAESSNAAEKPQNKKVKLCFEKADTNFTLIAFHGKKEKARLSTTVQESRIMNDKEIIWQCVEIEKDIWDKLEEKEVITFKTDKMFRKKVLGSATVGTLKFVYESAERDEHPVCLDFTDEPRDYNHILPSHDLTRVIIRYKMNENIFLFFKKVELTFEQLGLNSVVQAFRGNDKEPFYSEVTKPKKLLDGTVCQIVMMPVSGQQWNGLDDNKKIIFKDGNGTVLGSATAQVWLKTSEYWFEFRKRRDYYYANGAIYFKNANGKEERWHVCRLLN